MEPDANKQLIRRWIAMANAHFVGEFEEFIASDFVGHLSGSPDQDFAELKRLELGFAAAFPDTQYTIEDLIAEGDRVVLRVTTRGTNLGEFLGRPATRRRVTFTGIVIYRIENNRICESWAEIDFGGLLRQLAALAAGDTHGDTQTAGSVEQPPSGNAPKSLQ
ncbi:MAG: ester cyclase [Betaproteobacteria bacterium]